MKFGTVENPEIVDFTIPNDHPDTQRILKLGKKPLEIYVGCAKWNKTDLKNFYPKGTKGELSYYSSQFNSIELNATFHKFPRKEQVKEWKEESAAGFKFFPKVAALITQYRKLINVSDKAKEFIDAISNFEEKLGIVFLEMGEIFKPLYFDRVESFISEWPSGIPLAFELRHPDWYADKVISDKYFKLLEKHKITNIIVDTAGRRDMMHMRLTTPIAFIRWVGANHHNSDRERLEEWVERIKIWKDQGLEKLCFFVHQNEEIESPALSAYFIEKLNKELMLNLKVPQIL